MTITGNIHEVTNLVQFAPSFLLNPKNPKAGTFKNASGIRVKLTSVGSGGLPGAIFPKVSIDATSSATGAFSMNVPNNVIEFLNITKKAYFTCTRLAGTLKIMGQTIQIFEPVYRSAPFEFAKLKSDPLHLYFAPFNVPAESGITQKQVDAQIKAAKAKFKDLEKLSATIQNGKVAVTGSGRGATIKFNIDLSPSISSDLTRFIDGKVEDMDIDLPGPDFIVGICVSKDDIEDSIEDGIAKLMKEVNAGIQTELINQIAAGTGQSTSAVKAIFETAATVTFSKLNYPVVEQKEIKLVGMTMKIDVRAVVPKLAVGFPRKIV